MQRSKRLKVGDIKVISMINYRNNIHRDERISEFIFPMYGRCLDIDTDLVFNRFYEPQKRSYMNEYDKMVKRNYENNVRQWMEFLDINSPCFWGIELEY